MCVWDSIDGHSGINWWMVRVNVEWRMGNDELRARIGVLKELFLFCRVEAMPYSKRNIGVSYIVN